MNTIALFTICSIFSFAISSLIDKKLSTVLSGVRFSAALYRLPITALLFLPFAVISWKQVTAEGSVLLLAALIIGIIGGFEFELYYRGLRNGEASVLFPFLLSAAVALTSGFAIILFKEAPSLIRVVGILGVIAGNVLLIRSTGNAGNTRLAQLKREGLLYFTALVILTVASNLFAASFADVVASGFVLAGWTYIFIVVTLIVLNGVRLTEHFDEYIGGWVSFLATWPLLAAAAVTGLIGRWFLYAALIRGGEATYVFPFVEGGEILVLSIVAVLLFRETNTFQKWMAIALLLLSVIAITFSAN